MSRLGGAACGRAMVLSGGEIAAQPWTLQRCPKTRGQRTGIGVVVTPPDVDEPVEPLVPELLLVPAAPPDEVDGMVDVEPPEAPMPDLVPEVDDPPMPEEPLMSVAPPMCGPSEVGALVEAAAAGALLAGEVMPLAEPAPDPIPEAEPVAEPDIDGPELQAARAADAASAIKILCMDVSPGVGCG